MLMLISSRRILVIHMALGSPYLETYVYIPKSLFVTIGWVGKLLAFIYYESILLAILDYEVSTNGILGDF